MTISWLPSPLSLLPQPATAVGLGVVLNLFFTRHPDLKVRLRELAGKVFRFEVEDLGQEFFMTVDDDGSVRIHTYCDEVHHVTLSGASKAFLALMFNRSDPDSLFFSRELKMAGETDTGLHFKNILNNVDMDWEQELAGFVGRPMARLVENMTRRAWEAGQRGRERLEEETERWMDESGIPRRADLNALRDQVAQLEGRLDRLNRACTRLHNKLAVAGAAPEPGTDG
ncbi:MAG: SCP2 sterol-binding domain-containing protein [Magnetococcales bacterium]|nr:SCP2 sterol-binding domain-containing protein [Magnetococcales bacterium]